MWLHQPTILAPWSWSATCCAASLTVDKYTFDVIALLLLVIEHFYMLGYFKHAMTMFRPRVVGRLAYVRLIRKLHYTYYSPLIYDRNNPSFNFRRPAERLMTKQKCYLKTRLTRGSAVSMIQSPKGGCLRSNELKVIVAVAAKQKQTNPGKIHIHCEG